VPDAARRLPASNLVQQGREFGGSGGLAAVDSGS
jgi:hypothetical protein